MSLVISKSHKLMPFPFAHNKLNKKTSSLRGREDFIFWVKILAKILNDNYHRLNFEKLSIIIFLCSKSSRPRRFSFEKI